MITISSEIEIASSPERVRQVFMDFPKMSEWTQGFIKSIEPTPPKTTIAKGDKLKVVLEGMIFNPTVLENSDRQFQWRGSIPILFHGDHSFRFEPSKNTPGSTTFVQSEEFSGPLSLLMKLPFGLAEKTAPGFDKFNEDLKRRVEGST